MPPLHPRCRCAIMYREVGEKKPSKAPAPRPTMRNPEFNFDIQRFGGQPLPPGNYNLTVRRQVQNRHIEGTKEHVNYIEQNRKKNKAYLPSEFFTNVNVQDLVYEFHGKGVYAPHPDSKQCRERVNTGRVIGRYWDYKEERFVDTTWIMIVYSQNGTHAYPIYPLDEEL